MVGADFPLRILAAHLFLVFFFLFSGLVHPGADEMGRILVGRSFHPAADGAQ